MRAPRSAGGGIGSSAATRADAAVLVGIGVAIGVVGLATGSGELAAQPAATAGWVTVAQQVDIELRSGDGSAEVDVRFELAAAREGAPLPLSEPIPFELLGFGEASADEILLGSGERIVLWPTHGSHRVAVVVPPPEVEGDRLGLAVSYRVADVVEGEGPASAPAIHARVPILTGPPVRAGDGAAAFDARLSTPERWALTEGFPSGLTEVEPGVHEVSLTVAPSVVGFRARTDGVWRPGFPLLVDLLTVLILVTFAGFGWRHLRSVAAGGGER